MKTFAQFVTEAYDKDVMDPLIADQKTGHVVKLGAIEGSPNLKRDG